MKNTLYLECLSGISGDMMVAALLDLGADEKCLREGLESLPVEGFRIEISRVKKSGLDACDFCVVLDEEHENQDHDMEYLHGHSDEYHHPHDHTHYHAHRGFTEICEIIDNSTITEHAKILAKKTFEIMAQAEAKAHGLPQNQVHFHEVGAVDSIVDIIASAICIDNLGLEEVIVPELYEGRGTVRCQHGVLPIPVPAVVNIVEKYQVRLHMTDVAGELVTPTGAAIVAAIRTTEQLPESFYIKRIGLGAGKREYKTAGILRAMLIERK